MEAGNSLKALQSQFELGKQLREKKVQPEQLCFPCVPSSSDPDPLRVAQVVTAFSIVLESINNVEGWTRAGKNNSFVRLV